MTAPERPDNRLELFFPGDSEMANRMRAFDWAATDFGPVENWPAPLRIAVRLCLTSRFPILLWWGPNLCLLYNDAYLPWLTEAKHPRALGRAGYESWSEIWDVIGPMLDGVVSTRKASWSEDVELFYDRKVQKEEVYITWSFVPILAADGESVDGIFNPCVETTEKVIGARRLETLRRLAIRSGETRTVEEACKKAAVVLGENTRDIPFAAIYEVGAGGDEAKLCATMLPDPEHVFPLSVSVREDHAHSPWPLASVLQTRHAAECTDLEAFGVRLSGGEWPESVRDALVLPIYAAQDQLAGLVVVGVSPRRPLDAAYRTFFDLVAGHIATAISDARAYEAERQRAEALAELDRAKTAFFSNVSHEEIIQRKRAEQALHASEERFRSYFELGLIGMAMTSPTKGILDVNDEICRILGYERSELLQKTWAELTHPEDLAADVAQFNRVMAGEIDGYTLDKRWIRKDGRVIDSITGASCLRHPDGSVNYFVGLLQDITERKHADEALQNARAELAHMSRGLTIGEMAASIAHEVNQPLAAIATYANACLRWLRREVPDLKEAENAADNVIENALRAGDVIKGLRELVKGRPPNQQPIHLNEIIHHVITLINGELKKNEIVLRTELDPDLPLVMGDRVQLEQVLLNLMMNSKDAMTAADCPARELLIRSQLNSADELTVAVQDSGPGLRGRDSEHIFDSFVTTKESGLGLGLSISRRIVEAHGGKLWASRSNEGAGACFQFSLPIIHGDAT